MEVEISPNPAADLVALEAHSQDTDDVMESNVATEVQTEDEISQDDIRRQLRETIATGSLDFDTWTSLISDIEKYYSDEIETISLVYDSFLSKFPLCHVYWKKYAYHKTRLCTVDLAVEIFERGVQSATYCLDLWVDYCRFSMAAFEDPDDIRRLFNRGMSFVGKDYLCHTLWDKYIEFEYSQHQWNCLLKILIQTLRFPTKKLHKYYENLKIFAAILDEETECQNDCVIDMADSLPDGAVMSEDEICSIINDLQKFPNGSMRSQAVQKYLSVGMQIYHKSSQLDEKIHCFETALGRSFFHVKPLDDNQLANWHSYLDFIEKQEDFDWTVKLHERCLIPCANYPEFWMRYVELMETKGGREIANFALERATQIFLENAPVIHIFNARFREQIGDVYGARAALLQGDTEANSYFVGNVIKAANMEKRLGNLEGASDIYEKALRLAEERQKLHTVPVLYIHYSRLKYLITGTADAAVSIMMDGIEHVPHCRLLLEELLKFLMMHEGSKHVNVVDSIIVDEITSGPEISPALSTKDREDLSCLYLEFIDLCGTNHDVRKAWNRHIKLFPHLIRTSTSYKHPTATTQLLDLAREGRKRKPFSFPNQPSKNNDSDKIHTPVREQDALPLEDHGIQTDQVVAEKFQPKEDDSGAQEQQSPKASVQSRDDISDVHESEESSVHQSRNDVSVAIESTQVVVYESKIDSSESKELTYDLIHQSGQATSGPKESNHEFEQSTGPIAPSELLIESSSSPHKQEIAENELEKHPKPSHLERFSLSSHNESQGFPSMELEQHGIVQKITVSDENVLELGLISEEIPDAASPKSSSVAASVIQNESGRSSSKDQSSSNSRQNSNQNQTEPQLVVPASSGEDCYQNATTTASGGTGPTLHEHLHDVQLQDSPHQQQSTAEMVGQVQVQNASQGGDQYKSVASQGTVQHPSYVSAPLSAQSQQPVVPHSQPPISQYTTQTTVPGPIHHSHGQRQMLQHLQQQQQFLQQQYPHQMLQLQQPYLHLQQQQFLYQQQQQQSVLQHHQYLQQTQQLQQPPYQRERQHYLFYLLQQQQQIMQQNLLLGQQVQGTQLEGQEHQMQLQQYSQSTEHTHQQNLQVYQLLLQQYQAQQQQGYGQSLLQQQQQQQQLLQHQLQQQQITSAKNQRQSSSNYLQEKGFKPPCTKDAAGTSDTRHPLRSSEGMSQAQTMLDPRPASPNHRHHSPHKVPASHRSHSPFSASRGDQYPMDH